MAEFDDDVELDEDGNPIAPTVADDDLLADEGDEEEDEDDEMEGMKVEGADDEEEAD